MSLALSLWSRLRSPVLMLSLSAWIAGMVVMLFSRDLTNPGTIGHSFLVWAIIPALLGMTLLNVMNLPSMHEGYAHTPLLPLIAAAASPVLLATGDALPRYTDFVVLATLAGTLAVSAWVYQFIAYRTGLFEPDQSDPAALAGESAQGLLPTQPYTPAQRTASDPTELPTRQEPDYNRLSDYPARAPRHTFAQVVGMDALKSRLRDAATEIVSAQRKNRPPRNGILFSGSPGNGKTFLAEAIAGEMQLRFLCVSFGDFASRWKNQTSEQVRKVFDEARRQAPCVLFLDEVDSVLGNRAEALSSDSEGPKTTNVMLTELVDIRAAGVVVIAATNFLEKLDPAAVREGRFDFKIEIPPPDAPARRSLVLHTILNWRGLQIDASALDQATKRWDGFSIARIRAIVEETCRQVEKTTEPVIAYPDLQQALRTVQGSQGNLPENTPTLDALTLSPKQRQEMTRYMNLMRHIEFTESRGGTVPTGLLFSGPPGTGKTLMARALAKSTDWGFLATTGADLLRETDAIDRLALRARDLRPCIVFIDEADDICSIRGYGSSGVTLLTNKLLSVMDGAYGKASDVMWIAATNHVERFDPAIQRRLSNHIRFELPDAATLSHFITQWLTARPVVELDRPLRPQTIAAGLAGFSIAHAQEILQLAVNHAIALSLPAESVAIESCLPMRTLIRAADLEAARETVRAAASPINGG